MTILIIPTKELTKNFILKLMRVEDEDLDDCANSEQLQKIEAKQE